MTQIEEAKFIIRKHILAYDLLGCYSVALQDHYNTKQSIVSDQNDADIITQLATKLSKELSNLNEFKPVHKAIYNDGFTKSIRIIISIPGINKTFVDIILYTNDENKSHRLNSVLSLSHVLTTSKMSENNSREKASSLKRELNDLESINSKYEKIKDEIDKFESSLSKETKQALGIYFEY